MNNVNLPQGDILTKDLFPESTRVFGSFGQRLVAALLDGILISVGLSIVGLLFGWDSMWSSLRMEDGFVMNYYRSYYSTSGIADIIVSWLYAALMESSERGATLGKMAMGLRVTDEHGQRISFGRATGRHFGKMISAIILFIGYLMMLWDDKKQTLHDKLANTLVIKDRG
ncbi:MAG: RDD family protein [Chitinophagaceae bacterium]